MKLIYDARPLCPATRDYGPGVVIDNVIRHLPREIVPLGISDRFVRRTGDRLWQWPRLPKTSRLFFNLAPALQRGAVYWGTNHTLPMLPPRRPKVVTVHDLLSTRTSPQGEPGIRLTELARAVKAATLVAVVTHAILKELVALFPQHAGKCRVIHNGVNLPGLAQAPSDRPIGPGRRIEFLIAGAHHRRKNVDLALEAVRRLRADGLAVRVTISGDVHPCFHDAIGRSRDFVDTTGMLPRERLAELYRGSDILLYSSSYEGFGLPILEGLGAGCIVVALDTDVSREVGGDAAAYFPDDVDAWYHGLREIILSPRLQHRLREAAAANVARFSWKACAETYAACFLEASAAERGLAR